VIPVIGVFVAHMVVNVSAFVAPAALVVGLKVIALLGKKPAVKK
jgi:hypothetical protein